MPNVDNSLTRDDKMMPNLEKVEVLLCPWLKI